MKIAITGANGFVGKNLTQNFTDFIVIDRKDNVNQIVKKLENVEVVINLAGAPIIQRWNEEYKKILKSSRIETTKKLVEAINQSNVKHFISTSAIGVYPNDKISDEYSHESADDFLAQIVKEWEEEARKCTKKVTILRFGVVLGKDGGALSKMLTPFKMGVGGIIGDGKMMTSWIVIDDLINIYKFIIENEVEGTFNAVSPNPVSNHTFTKALGKVLHRPTIFPLPTFVLKLIFGEASSVLTDSKEVYPKALQSAGYKFLYPDITKALEHVLK